MYTTFPRQMSASLLVHSGGYQAFIISELVLRVTGKRVREFIAEGLAGPLKADFQLGVLPKDRSRVAEIISPPLDISTDFDIDSLAGRALTTLPYGQSLPRRLHFGTQRDGFTQWLWNCQRHS
jgi:hypothetical protein